jgi:hypothetical protein
MSGSGSMARIVAAAARMLSLSSIGNVGGAPPRFQVTTFNFIIE